MYFINDKIVYGKTEKQIIMYKVNTRQNAIKHIVCYNNGM